MKFTINFGPSTIPIEVDSQNVIISQDKGQREVIITERGVTICLVDVRKDAVVRTKNITFEELSCL